MLNPHNWRQMSGKISSCWGIYDSNVMASLQSHLKNLEFWLRFSYHPSQIIIALLVREQNRPKVYNILSEKRLCSVFDRLNLTLWLNISNESSLEQVFDDRGFTSTVKIYRHWVIFPFLIYQIDLKMNDSRWPGSNTEIYNLTCL